jgi:hypothetical protein
VFVRKEAPWRVLGQQDVGRALAVGRELVAAVAEEDWERVASTLHPWLYLRSLTPGKFNVVQGRDAVAQAVGVFKLWFFEDDDRLMGIEGCDVRPIGHRWAIQAQLRVLSKESVIGLTSP